MLKWSAIAPNMWLSRSAIASKMRLIRGAIAPNMWWSGGAIALVQPIILAALRE